MKRILILLAGAAIACGHQAQPDCVQPTCALPVAIRLTVTSPSGDPVPGVTVTVGGALSGFGQCGITGGATQCTIFGSYGTFTLLLSAPGFQDKPLTVAVPGSPQQCACPTVQTQQVIVVLTPK